MEDNIYRAIFEHTGTAMSIVGEDTVIQLVNSKYEKLSGYSKDELEGKISWQMFTVEEELERNLDFFHKNMNAEDVAKQFEFRFRNRRGEIKDVFITHGVIPHTRQGIASLIDITDRKEAETKLISYKNQLRELSAHIQQVSEQERRQIAQEIHDELGQTFTAIKLLISVLHKKLAETPELREKAAEIDRLADDAIEFVRRIYSDLHPRMVEDLGLVAALECLFEKLQGISEFKGSFETNITDIPKLEVSNAVALFRISQEAMTNAIKHAKASTINVSLNQLEGNIVLSVCDDGCGISGEDRNSSRSFGLLGMRERAIALNGNLEIDTSPTNGTCVSAKIPLKSLGIS